MTVTLQGPDNLVVRRYAAYYELTSDPKTQAPCVDISFLSGKETSYSTERSYDELVKKGNFCVFDVDANDEVYVIYLPKGISDEIIKKKLPCHVLLPLSDHKRYEAKYSPNTNLVELSDGLTAHFAETLKAPFLNFTAQSEPSSLSSRASVAPVTPKSKGGFWSRLFNKTS